MVQLPASPKPDCCHACISFTPAFLHVIATKQIPEVLSFVAQERERKLQNNLIVKIDRFMRGDTDGFALSVMNEAQRLSEAAYGSAFLHTIG